MIVLLTCPHLFQVIDCSSPKSWRRKSPQAFLLSSGRLHPLEPHQIVYAIFEIVFHSIHQIQCLPPLLGSIAPFLVWDAFDQHQSELQSICQTFADICATLFMHGKCVYTSS